jgi:hypothetical protein
VAVASPVQWCPCPMHGSALPVHSEHAHSAAHMPMPAANPDAPATRAPMHHEAPGSPHAAHQCTCPGGCCSTTPVGLLAHTLRVAFAMRTGAPVRVAQPTDTIDLASSPQLALPPANGPPASRVTLQNAAQHTT